MVYLSIWNGFNCLFSAASFCKLLNKLKKMLEELDDNWKMKESKMCLKPMGRLTSLTTA